MTNAFTFLEDRRMIAGMENPRGSEGKTGRVMSGSFGFSQVWVLGVGAWKALQQVPWPLCHTVSGRGGKVVLGRGSTQVGSGALSGCCAAALD